MVGQSELRGAIRKGPLINSEEPAKADPVARLTAIRVLPTFTMIGFETRLRIHQPCCRKLPEAFLKIADSIARYQTSLA